MKNTPVFCFPELFAIVCLSIRPEHRHLYPPHMYHVLWCLLSCKHVLYFNVVLMLFEERRHSRFASYCCNTQPNILCWLNTLPDAYWTCHIMPRLHTAIICIFSRLLMPEKGLCVAMFINVLSGCIFVPIGLFYFFFDNIFPCKQTKISNLELNELKKKPLSFL